MGTGSVERLVLKWLRRLPTVPVPFSDGPLASTVKNGDWLRREAGFEVVEAFADGACPPFSDGPLASTVKNGDRHLAAAVSARI